MGLFSRFRRRAAQGVSTRFDAGDMGAGLLAARLEQGGEAPAACVLVVFSESGHARRSGPGAAAGARGPGETAFCFHPGPYSIDLAPFAAAPELGLRTRFVVDAGDPRVAQQRFDLYLFSEAPEVLSVAAFGAAIESAVQGALEQGVFELPPCTSLDEWNVFRAGLNQLLYTRFGVTVEDCIPVDLGDSVDYAALLRARVPAEAAQPPRIEPEAPVQPTQPTSTPQQPQPTPTAQPQPQPNFALEPQLPSAAPPPAVAHAQPQPNSPAEPPPQPASAAPAAMFSATPADDAHALRRLFLELPALTGGLRLIALPPGQPLFLAHQNLLQRLALLGLDVNTMPSLAWAAPDQPVAPEQRARRAQHSVLAARTLDQAWALLARLQAPGAPAPDLPQLLDEADRLLSNLDHYLAARRAVQAPSEAEAPPPSPPSADGARREPSL